MAKRKWNESGHAELSVRQQCKLLDLARSSCYYPSHGESESKVASVKMRTFDFGFALAW